MPSSFFVGTSGWTYRHWIGVFYPENLPQREWFDFYKRHFNSVEINATFYRTPPAKTFEGWGKRAPQGFLFAVKMSQILTHKKKLTSPLPLLETLMERYRGIGEKLGPILIQLPPSLHLDVERLRDFLALLPKDLLFAVEFRHRSWFVNEVYEALDSQGIGFVAFHHPHLDCPRVVTGRLVYLRFHGTTSLYGGRYHMSDLEDWARFLKDHVGKRRKGFAYFNNDFEGNAVFDAMNLKRLLEGESHKDSRPGH